MLTDNVRHVPERPFPQRKFLLTSLYFANGETIDPCAAMAMGPPACLPCLKRLRYGAASARCGCCYIRTEAEVC